MQERGIACGLFTLNLDNRDSYRSEKNQRDCQEIELSNETGARCDCHAANPYYRNTCCAPSSKLWGISIFMCSAVFKFTAYTTFRGERRGRAFTGVPWRIFVAISPHWMPTSL